MQQQQLIENGNNFLMETRNLIATFDGPVVNCDQSGFTKELHTLRCLSPIGVKKVEIQAQSIDAMSHSYTVMPIYSMAGKLISPLLIVLQEKNGQFPQRGIFQV